MFILGSTNEAMTVFVFNILRIWQETTELVHTTNENTVFDDTDHNLPTFA